jgi:hypothetical protein
VIAALALAAALAAAAPSDPRRELAAVAARIEALKAEGVRGGRELEALLARWEALAREVERLDGGRRAASPAPAPPDAQELRERADALRDESDRLRAALGAVEARLREATRRRERAGRLAAVEEEGALFGDASAGRISGEWRSRGDAAAGGGPAPPGVQPPAGPTGEPASPGADPGSAGGGSPGGDAAGARVFSPPGAPRAWERLSPGPDDDVRDLRRKRAALLREVEAVEARIRGVDAEAARDDDARR